MIARLAASGNGVSCLSRRPHQAAGRNSTAAGFGLTISGSYPVSGSHDVVAQPRRVGLRLLDPMLDDVSNRHESHNLALIDNRHMPELAERHALHDVGNRFAVVAGLDLARHGLAHRFVQRACTARSKRAYDVSL